MTPPCLCMPAMTVFGFAFPYQGYKYSHQGNIRADDFHDDHFSEVVWMKKELDLKKTVYELCKDNDEIKEIMKELGFDAITSPGMLNTAGRFMTIPKGAAMKGIPMDKIREAFAGRGYAILE